MNTDAEGLVDRPHVGRCLWGKPPGADFRQRRVFAEGPPSCARR
jgi:hypothetical protein